MLAGLTDWEQEKEFDITIQGNLTRDPKFSYSANGTPLVWLIMVSLMVKRQ